MKDIGRKIAMFRKAKNLTQMELADLLNISFQAVSNWERGETMPDISKLPEIAQIFNASIDDIIGNQQSTKTIENIIEGKLMNNEISAEDFKTVAPLLKPTQISEVSIGIKEFSDISGIIDYLPFVSREVADKIAEQCIESDQLMLEECIPFVSKKYADKLVLRAIEKNYELKDLIDTMPFVSREIADKIAQSCIENDLIMLEECMPFVSEEYADKLALRAIEKNYELKDLIGTMPFVSTEIADKIAKSCIENDLVMLEECMPFVSREVADRIVQEVLMAVKNK
jgi:transcriptional regulator with XRE-family HTH domain